MAIIKPCKSGSLYINYKGFFSIVLLALVDANYKFLYIDIGANCRISDGGVFGQSTLNKKIVNGKLNLPLPETLPYSQQSCPFFMVGDDAFPLKEYLMKPYPWRNLSPQESKFNYRLSRARQVVEVAFGILSQRFRIFLSTISLSPTKVEIIVKTCCVLHNYLIDQSDDYNFCFTNDQCNNYIKMLKICNQSSNASTLAARNVRQTLCTYFS